MLRCTHFIKPNFTTHSVDLLLHVLVSIYILCLSGIDKLYLVHIRTPVSLYLTQTDSRRHYYQIATLLTRYGTVTRFNH
jgi:hypothetical protein